MKALVVERYGSKHGPQRRVNDVLVRVHAAGVNPLDPKIGTSEFIRPILDRVFPFAAVGQVLAYFDSGHAKGKVIIGGTARAHRNRP